jgi:hypothetical protein
VGERYKWIQHDFGDYEVRDTQPKGYATVVWAEDRETADLLVRALNLLADTERQAEAAHNPEDDGA